MMAAVTSRLFVFLTFLELTTSFVVLSTRTSLVNNYSCLSAKKATKKPKKQPSNKGGFGASPPPSSKKLRSISSQAVGAGSKALRNAANAYDRIRKAHGVEQTSDVYVRSPLQSPTTYWFVGKVAYLKKSDDALSACLSQKRLILEYSKSELRPQNFGGKYAPSLEIWLAPGDSEMDVVRNKIDLLPVVGSASDLPGDFDADTVGYNPEIYMGDERTQGGLRVERDEQGKPIKAVFDIHEDQNFSVHSGTDPSQQQ